MEYSKNLGLNLPDDNDPLDVSKLSENFRILDETSGGSGGDIAAGMKVGDIVYSTRNLEEETGGKLIACDQRTLIDMPELFEMPGIAPRLPMPAPVPGNRTIGVSSGYNFLNMYAPFAPVTYDEYFFYLTDRDTSNRATYLYKLNINTGEQTGVSVSSGAMLGIINGELFTYESSKMNRRNLDDLSATQSVSITGTFYYGKYIEEDNLLFLFTDTSITRVDPTTLISSTVMFYNGEATTTITRLQYTRCSAELRPFASNLQIDEDGNYYLTAHLVKSLASNAESVAVFRSTDKGLTWHMILDVAAEFPDTFTGAVASSTVSVIGIYGSDLYCVFVWAADTLNVVKINLGTLEASLEYTSPAGSAEYALMGGGQLWSRPVGGHLVGKKVYLVPNGAGLVVYDLLAKTASKIYTNLNFNSQSIAFGMVDGLLVFGAAQPTLAVTILRHGYMLESQDEAFNTETLYGTYFVILGEDKSFVWGPIPFTITGTYSASGKYPGYTTLYETEDAYYFGGSYTTTSNGSITVPFSKMPKSQRIAPKIENGWLKIPD